MPVSVVPSISSVRASSATGRTSTKWTAWYGTGSCTLWSFRSPPDRHSVPRPWSSTNNGVPQGDGAVARALCGIRRPSGKRSRHAWLGHGYAARSGSSACIRRAKVDWRESRCGAPAARTIRSFRPASDNWRWRSGSAFVHRRNLQARCRRDLRTRAHANGSDPRVPLISLRRHQHPWKHGHSVTIDDEFLAASCALDGGSAGIPGWLQRTLPARCVAQGTRQFTRVGRQAIPTPPETVDRGRRGARLHELIDEVRQILANLCVFQLSPRTDRSTAVPRSMTELLQGGTVLSLCTEMPGFF